MKLAIEGRVANFGFCSEPTISLDRFEFKTPEDVLNKTRKHAETIVSERNKYETNVPTFSKNIENYGEKFWTLAHFLQILFYPAVQPQLEAPLGLGVLLRQCPLFDQHQQSEC